MAKRTTSWWRRLTCVAGALAGALAVMAAVWFVGMRTKWAPVLDLQRRINRKVVNPRQMRTAGSPGAYAGVIRHVGRRSGRRYETPVVPFPTADGFVVVLPYGTRPDWVQNVLAAGTAELVHEGRVHVVDAPEVRPIEPAELPESEQRTLSLFGNDQCLELRRAPNPSTASQDTLAT